MAGKNEEVECCSEECVHEDLLKIVNDTIPEETELYDLAELFKVFGDSTRIRILFVLSKAAEKENLFSIHWPTDMCVRSLHRAESTSRKTIKNRREN